MSICLCLLVLASGLLSSEVEAGARAVSISVDLYTSSAHTASTSCSFDPSLGALETVDQLTLYGSKPGSAKQDLQILASVDRWDTTPRTFGSLSVRAINLTGSFGFESNTSEIHVSWTSSPSQRSGYTYRCVVQGTDRTGQFVTISELAEISMSEDQLCPTGKMDILSLKLDELVKSTTASIDLGLNALERRLENVENAMNNSDENLSNRYMEPLQEKIQENADSMKTMTSVLSDLQRTMGRLEQSLAAQAVAVRKLDARTKFEISGEFRGKHYLVSRGRWTSIQQADSSCEAFGGYLVEIDDEAEFDFVKDFARHIHSDLTFAIGINDMDVEGHYMNFHSNTPVRYTKWNRGEPNNSRNEDCVSIVTKYGKMNDIPCGNPRYICEVQF